jgi:hypothetical protein
VYLIFARIAKAKKFYNIDRKSYILFFCLLMKIVSGENLFCEWFKEYFELCFTIIERQVGKKQLKT